MFSLKTSNMVSYQLKGLFIYLLAQNLSWQNWSSRSTPPSTETKTHKSLKSHYLIHVFNYPVLKVGNVSWNHIDLVAVPSLIAKSLQPKKLPERARNFLLIVTRRDITSGWGPNWHRCKSWRQTGAKRLKSWWWASAARRIVTNRCVLFSPLSLLPFALWSHAYLNTFGVAGRNAAAQVAVTVRWNPPHAVRLPRPGLSCWPFGQTHWQHALAYLGLVSQL